MSITLIHAIYRLINAIYQSSESLKLIFRQSFSKNICQLFIAIYILNVYTPRQKSIRALEIFRVQKLILNATS